MAGLECEICGATQNLVSDHCHSTGFRRGKLCSDCNLGLGFFFDEPQVLRDAAEYVERYKNNPTNIPYFAKNPIGRKARPKKLPTHDYPDDYRWDRIKVTWSEIVHMRFVEKKTLQEIATIAGVSKARIWQILR